MTNHATGAEGPPAEGTAPVEPVVAPEPVVTDPEPLTATEGDISGSVVTEEGPASSGDDPAADPQQSGVQKRINELNTKFRTEQESRATAEAEAAYWRGRAEEAQGPAQQQQSAAQGPPANPAPAPGDYETTAEWQAAMTSWVNESVQTATTRSAQVQTAEQQASTRNAQIMEASKEMPQLISIMNNPALKATPVMYDAADGPKFAEICNYLGTNTAEFNRIMRLSPAKQAAAIGNIEAKLSAPPPKPKTTSSAPDPSGGVGPGVGTPKTTTNPNQRTQKENFSSWEADRRRRAGLSP